MSVDVDADAGVRKKTTMAVVVAAVVAGSGTDTEHWVLAFLHPLHLQQHSDEPFGGVA